MFEDPRSTMMDCVYDERSVLIYPSRSGVVTLEQAASFGMIDIRLIVVIPTDGVPVFVNALLGAKRAIADPEADTEYPFPTGEVYLSGDDFVCVRPLPEAKDRRRKEDVIMIEPYRVDAIVDALQRAAAELTKGGGL